MYPKGYLGRDLVDDVCKEQGVELDTVMEVGSASSLLQLVEAGIGATIQPRGLLKQHSTWPNIVSIPISEPAPIRHLELTYYADRFVSKAHKQLSEWLIDFFKQEQTDQRDKHMMDTNNIFQLPTGLVVRQLNIHDNEAFYQYRATLCLQHFNLRKIKWLFSPSARITSWRGIQLNVSALIRCSMTAGFPVSSPSWLPSLGLFGSTCPKLLQFVITAI